MGLGDAPTIAIDFGLSRESNAANVLFLGVIKALLYYRRDELRMIERFYQKTTLAPSSQSIVIEYHPVKIGFK